MEIERKFLIKKIPFDLSGFPVQEIEQGYLCTAPVLRIRRKDANYILTYKSSGLMVREETELPLTAEAYRHLISKVDGSLITKTRHLIPYGGYTIELDIFQSPIPGLMLAEVEFPSVEEANAFTPPDWFHEDVTHSGKYHNSYLSRL